jgi:glutathione S-transferase
LKPRVDGEIANHLSYMVSALGSRSFFVGNDLTGADIMLLFPLEAAGARLDPYPNLTKYRARMQDRSAYKRGIEKGGPYALMSR